MVMAHPVSSGSKFSNESLLERLSCNIFITNFPTTMSAKELWNTCAKYGTLLDVYIPEKMSKMGKRFAFARYHKVYDVDMLIRNLSLVQGFLLIQQRNVAPVMVLERGTLNYQGDPVLWGVLKNSKLFQHSSNMLFLKFSSLKQWTSNFEIKDRVVWIECRRCVFALRLVFNILLLNPLKLFLKERFSIVRAKEVTGWVPDFVDDNSNEFEDPFGLEGLILKSLKKRNVKDVKESTVIPSNSDIPAKDGAKQVSEDNEPKFPPGFTPSNSDLPLNNEKTVQDNVTSPVSMRTSSNRPDFNELGQTKTNQACDGKSDIESKNKSHGGAKQDHVDSMTLSNGYGNEWFCEKDYNEGLLQVRGDQVLTLNDLLLRFNNSRARMDMRKIHGVKTLFWPSKQVNFLSLQETKMVSLDVFVVKAIWGNMYFDFATSSARGTWLASNSDLLETKMVSLDVFVVKAIWGNMYFDFATSSARGTWLASNSDLLVMSVYSPQDLSQKRVLWAYMNGIINRWHGEVIAMGDFNEFLEPDFVSIVKDSWNNDGIFDNNAMTLLKNKLNCLKLRLKKWSIDKKSIKEHDCNTLLDSLRDIDSRLDKGEDCGADKSLGPDGFTFEFFRKFWYIVGKEVINVVKEFFNSSVFPKRCNPSFISFIPKVLDAKRLNNFRPINLIGCQYKIIGKILANHLSMVIDNIISQEQSAFIKGRQITDGPLILNEIISWCKSKKMQSLLFKVDFQKAFDSVCWDHLDDILGKLGFGNKWRGWIRGCLLSSKALVLVNGSPTDELHFHRGLRQGDPLSPFLFILVMESLYVSFQRLIDRGMFDPILVGKDNLVPISHLFYADDVMFIGKWTCENVNALMMMLQWFFLAYGLKVNMQKSSLCSVGVRSSDIQSMADRYGCLATNIPFTHLGVKVGVNMSKINFWNEVVQKVRSKLSSWKAKTLSVGGRLTLIKSVLGAIPTYYLSLYKVPEGVLSHLESLRNSFLLGADVGERKITWVCWRKVMAHKQLSGLEVSSLYALNLALLFKWIWRFRASRPALWIKIIKAIHGNTGHLDCTISSPSGCSVWLGVLKAIAKLKSKGVDLLEFAKKCYNLEIQKDASVAFKLNDHWAWTLDAHGVFSVKSARQAIDKQTLDNSSTSIRWSKILPIKLNIFLWSMFLDKLPTKSNLSARGVAIPCTLFTNRGSVVETRNHLFFGCSMASDLFQLLGRWWNIQVPTFSDFSSWESWFASLRLNSLQKRTLVSIFFIPCGFILVCIEERDFILREEASQRNGL
ncbi:RNA-directed DNA polymerase, eukaryota [Tanacetum coccineum]